MATFTVRPEGIIRQPALTMPGNATGAEAACTSLTASQIRTLLGLGTTSDVTFDIVRATTSVQTPLVNNASAALTLGNSTYGVTVPGAATFSGGITGYSSAPWMKLESSTNGSPYYQWKNTGHDRRMIMNSSGHLAVENVTTQANILFLGATGKLGVGNFYAGAEPTASIQTSGNLAVGYVQGSSPTVPSGGIVAAGDISMSKTSAQGYIYAYSPDGTKSGSFYCGNTGLTTLDCNASFDINSTNGRIRTSGTTLEISPAGGSAYVFRSGANSTFDVYNSGSPSSRYIRLTHDSTNGILSTSSGNLQFDLGAAGGFFDFRGVAATNNIVRINNNLNTQNLSLQHNGRGIISTSSGALQLSSASTGIELKPAGGYLELYTPSANSKIWIFDGSGGSYTGLTHDGSNGILNVSSGNLNLVPTGGTVAVTGGITASGNVTLTGSTATVAASTSLLRLTSAATGFEFRPAAGYIEQLTSGSDGQYRIYNSAGSKFLRLDYDTALNRARIAADKICLDANNTTGVVSIGQTGNSGDPGLKRGGVGILSARLGDDSADAAFTCAGITASGVVSHGAYTVATLPAAGSNAGKMAQVTDSNVAASGNYGATVAAGGANRVKVFSDGTNWVIA